MLRRRPGAAAGVTRRFLLAGGGAMLASGAAARLVSPPRDLVGAARSIVGDRVRDHGFQGVVLLGRGGAPRFSVAVGSADIARDTAMADDTPFGIGSISKRLTAVAVMRLVDRGRLALDAPISTYLPGYRSDTGARVTLRHLLSNSSGIPNLFLPAVRADASLISAEMPAAEAIQRFASGDLVFEAGTRFDYTPTNWFILLGIIETVSGTAYAEAMRSLVIDPLELKDTALDATIGTAISYRSLSPAVEWLDGRPAYRAASGGYFSTARDMLRFAHCIYDTGFLSRASRSALITVQVASASYALGGRIRQVPIDGTDVATAWETGNIAGYRSVLGHRLDGRGAVAILNNTAMSQRIMDEFAEALLQLRL